MMNATPYKKTGPSITGGRVLRRMPDATLRPVTPPTVMPDAPRSFWQRVWAAVWPAPTLEQLHARQARHAELRTHRTVMTVGGHLALTSGPDITHAGRRAQADLP